MTDSSASEFRAPGRAFAPRLDCVGCMVRQAREALAQIQPPPEVAERALRRVLALLAEADWRQSPPALGQKLHRLIRETTGQRDPYSAIKRRLNRRAAEMRPRWSRRFQEAHPPWEAAVRLAIAGNLLDVGAKTQLREDAVENAFAEALTAPLRGTEVSALTRAVAAARSILYLADNAGEIVFDRDLLALLPRDRCTLVVRGAPVLNDATREDAEEAGLAGLCPIMDNGSDAPGTLLEDCSPAFRERFAAADLIIAKGQGNFESLTGMSRPIFFLLKVKCPLVAEALDCPVGSLVLRQENAASAAPASAP
jgi:uncharacterized protein with ATP-grasp and redox domains